MSSAGVITTPGVAYLARSRGFDAGVVISASHNPWTDNGIKVFSGDGFKLPDAREVAIEQEIFSLIERGAEIPEPAAKPAPSLPGERFPLSNVGTTLREAHVPACGYSNRARLPACPFPDC